MGRSKRYMKAKINGIEVVGTPREIYEIIVLSRNNKINIVNDIYINNFNDKKIKRFAEGGIIKNNGPTIV